MQAGYCYFSNSVGKAPIKRKNKAGSFGKLKIFFKGATFFEFYKISRGKLLN